MGRRIAILGAGGCAREVYWYIRETWPDSDVVFVDDLTELTALRMGESLVPVIKNWCFDAVRFTPTGDPCPVSEFIVGVGLPAVKKIMVEKALAHALCPAPTLIHPRAIVIDPGLQAGSGGFVAPGTVLTTNVQLGDYVSVHYNVTIGHDTVIGDYASCNPGCNISGNVTLGKGVLIGAGSVIREKVRIADDVIAGAQSCVVNDILVPGSKVVGVPAREL